MAFYVASLLLFSPSSDCPRSRHVSVSHRIDLSALSSALTYPRVVYLIRAWRNSSRRPTTTPLSPIYTNISSSRDSSSLPPQNATFLGCLFWTCCRNKALKHAFFKPGTTFLLRLQMSNRLFGNDLETTVHISTFHGHPPDLAYE
jgi:hypothetical protein